MELKTFYYKKSSGWSMKGFPKLDSPSTLVLIFSAQEFINHQERFHELYCAYPMALKIGCSTGGEIYESSLFDSSIVVSVMKFKNTKIRLAHTEIFSMNGSFTAGEKIAHELAQGDLRGVFVLSDGLQVNGSELVKGLNSILAKNIAVTGGLAGDGARFKKTWVLINDQIKSGSVVGVGFYGDNVTIGHGSRGGWESFGPDRLITRSKGNILYELDDQPALLLYKKYLGNRAKELPASGLLFPIAIREHRQDSKEVVRTILAVDKQANALVFAGDMPTGYSARLMKANIDRLITGASNAALKAAEKQKKATPLLAIAISCIGRRLLMGEYIEEEIEATLDSLSKHTRQVGFYSYGEISPFSTGDGECDLHNQTMTVTTISEEE